MPANPDPQTAQLVPFKREERFIVVKRKHLDQFTEVRLRDFLRTNEISTVECVVVESDWPEYETVWAMIEARCTGMPLPHAKEQAAGVGDPISAYLAARPGQRLTAFALAEMRDEMTAHVAEMLDRIEATLDAAERIMNASPFWDENSRYAGKSLIDYPRSQIAVERQALAPAPASSVGEGHSGDVERAMLADVARFREEEPEDGHWRPCTGCHETEDGYEVGHYPFSEAFQSKVGAGCSECGGLGVIWDNTDYVEMADWMIRQDRTHDAVEAAIRQNVRQVGDILVGVAEATDAIMDLEEAAPDRAPAPADLVDRLSDLLSKVDSPNGHEWKFPLRVVPCDGKPIIASNRGGNLFRGYIATWQEADLIVETLNALPTLLAALRSPDDLAKGRGK